ncbi:MAG TPA: threonine/serine dehydratase [Vicinamibacterales bacterium]|nr:threonine/serine dehydratase [Vicinamibacterales bacterium]
MLPSPSDVIAAATLLSGNVIRTPLVRSAWLSSATGGDVWLKLENRQLEGSFKTRGALYALMRSGAARAVTASAGNHGRALAYAAKTLGVPLTVFAPATAPRAKLDPIRGHGAALELRETYDEAERDAIAFARARGIPYISPYNHPDVIAGAGTAGLDVLEDVPDIGMLIVPVGGGGLASGIALAAAVRGGRAGTAGVEAAASPVFTSALAAGRLVEVKVSPTLADGLAGNAEPGSITFDLIRDLRVGVQTVTEDEIASAMRGLMAREGERVEGAGAVGVAALLSGAIDVRDMRAAVIVSGGNVDPEKLQQQEPGAEAEQDEGQQRPEQHGHS